MYLSEKTMQRNAMTLTAINRRTVRPSLTSAIPRGAVHPPMWCTMPGEPMAKIAMAPSASVERRAMTSPLFLHHKPRRGIRNAAPSGIAT
jgi:hypothetical protein